MTIKKNKFNGGLSVGFGLGIFGGIILGMLIQQLIFMGGVVEVAEGLEGTTFNIEVDVNETIMVDRMIEFFNDTIQKEKELEGFWHGLEYSLQKIKII